MSAKPMLRDDPQYVKALGDLARLDVSEAETRRELADLDQRIAAMEADPPGQAVDAAMDLVEGRRPPEATLVALRDDARQRLAVLQRGIDAQRKHITALAAELSRQECERMRLEHARLAERIVETAVALEVANGKEWDFRIDIEERGYSSGALPSMQLEVSGLESHLRAIWFYVRRHGGKPLPKLVKGRALVDLPAHGVKAGEVVELGGLDALELEHARHFDPNVDEKAVRRQDQMAARF